MTLYRVFPFDPSARSTGTRRPLYAPDSGAGRIANPDLYRELYLSDSSAGALAEALAIYRSKKWVGVAWWSRYDSRWSSIGLWDRKRLRITGDPEVLSLEHAAVQAAATLLPRHLTSRAP